MIFDLITTLLTVAIAGVLVIGLLAPIESLGWWAGHSDEPTALLPEAPAVRADTVVVYLSGIGSISGEELLAEEGQFLDRLQTLIPGATIVRDVFRIQFRASVLRAHGCLRVSGTCWAYAAQRRPAAEQPDQSP